METQIQFNKEDTLAKLEIEVREFLELCARVKAKFGGEGDGLEKQKS